MGEVDDDDEILLVAVPVRELNNVLDELYVAEYVNKSEELAVDDGVTDIVTKNDEVTDNDCSVVCVFIAVKEADVVTDTDSLTEEDGEDEIEAVEDANAENE